MTTTTHTPTNEQIAIDLLGWRGHYDVDSQWWERGGDAIATLPDYLNDPATLGEAERYCRERGWEWQMWSFTTNGGERAFGATIFDQYGNLTATAGAVDTGQLSQWQRFDDVTPAMWTALWRASQAEATG